MRAFANARAHVRIVERASGRDFTTSTTNAFAERDFYTVTAADGEDDPRSIEGLYATVEGLAAPTFQELLAERFPLDPEPRSEWALFMALQVTRGPVFRTFMKQTTDQIGRMVLRMAAERPPAYWRAARAAWEATGEGPEPPKPLSKSLRQMFRVGGGNFDIVPSREHVIEMSFVALEEMTFVLMAMTWRLVRLPCPSLFTSEHPVTYWRPPSPADRFTGIGPATAAEVRMPLSPSLALVLTPPERGRRPFDRSLHEQIYEVDEDAARRLNWGTLTFPPSDHLMLSPEVVRHPLPATLEQTRLVVGC